MASAPEVFARADTRSGRQTHDKARAEGVGCDICFGWSDVFGPDDTTMRFDNLFGNGKAKPGIVAEMLIRALRVKTLENL